MHDVVNHDILLFFGQQSCMIFYWINEFDCFKIKVWQIVPRYYHASSMWSNILPNKKHNTYKSKYRNVLMKKILYWKLGRIRYICTTSIYCNLFFPRTVNCWLIPTYFFLVFMMELMDQYERATGYWCQLSYCIF